MTSVLTVANGSYCPLLKFDKFIQMCNGCWGVVSRDGLGLGGIIDAPGYRAHSSVAMARMFKGIRVSASSSTPD